MMSISYSVILPGAAPWADGIPSVTIARLEAAEADRVAPGHEVVAVAGDQRLVLPECPECENARAILAGGRLQATCSCGYVHRLPIGLAGEGGGQ